MPYTVGMMLFPEMTQLDLTGPFEVFARMPQVKIVLIAPSRESVRSEFGLPFTPDCSVQDCPPLDIVFVPGGSGISHLIQSDQAIKFLQDRSAAARYVTSVCTGALVLGAAGLLRGYRATTHWLSMDLLPLVGAIPVHERVVVDRNRITGAGVTSGIDFALRVAAELFGRKTAEQIQLMLEYSPDPPYQSGSPKTAPPEMVRAFELNRREFQEKRKALLLHRMASYH